MTVEYMKEIMIQRTRAAWRSLRLYVDHYGENDPATSERRFVWIELDIICAKMGIKWEDIYMQEDKV